MPRVRTLLSPLLPWLLVLSSCSSPPQPPQVEESKKRPANAASAVELQSCRSDLAQTQLLLVDSRRAAEASAAQARAALARQAQQERRSALEAAASAQPLANSVYTVAFDYGSTQVTVQPEVASALLDEARTAPLVLLRGRTDGTAESPGESHIARARADAVRRYLVAAGVDPTHIRSTYQAIGDHVADNDSAAGRRFNRRVEIEIYRAQPVSVTPAAIAQAPH